MRLSKLTPLQARDIFKGVPLYNKEYENDLSQAMHISVDCIDKLYTPQSPVANKCRVCGFSHKQMETFKHCPNCGQLLK